MTFWKWIESDFFGFVFFFVLCPLLGAPAGLLSQYHLGCLVLLGGTCFHRVATLTTRGCSVEPQLTPCLLTSSFCAIWAEVFSPAAHVVFCFALTVFFFELVPVSSDSCFAAIWLVTLCHHLELLVDE